MLAMAATADATPLSLTVSSGCIAGAGHLLAPATVADATIATPGLTDTLTLSGNLSGAGPITKSGPGLLVLSGSNCYGEGTIVTAGTLEVMNSAALPENTSLTVGVDAPLLFGGSAQANASSSNVQAVPEPGTLALLGIGAVGLLACAWRKRQFS
jgi:autotransporter-associated beta strand protein